MDLTKDREFEIFIQRLIQGADGVYFRDVIRAATGQEIVPVDETYLKLINRIKTRLKTNFEGIQGVVERKYQGRANELGNFIEGILAEQLVKAGFRVERSAGYPDLLARMQGKHLYIECKIYQRKTADSSLRTFYYKVSKKSDIKHSCPHLLIGFEVESLGGDNKSPFRVKDFKIVDLYQLKVNLKPEFNASNPMIYQDCKIL
jgi:hypothetical protein